MKTFLSFALLLLVCACTQPGTQTVAVTPQLIENAISNGSYSRAEGLIKEYLHANPVSFKEQQKWLFQIEKMNRIRMDFSASDSAVLSHILNYYDSISPLQIRIWEEGNALEYKIIDGKKRYFKHAAPNLFRISAAARKQWERIHGNRLDSLQRFLAHYIPTVVSNIQTSGRTLSNPVSMEVTYTLTVNPNAVPAGELVRVWMPMPRTDVSRQTDVQLISTNQPNFIVSSDQLSHKTIYMEKKAILDEPTIFSYTFSYTSYAEWHNFNASEIKLYNTQSQAYQTFTTEQPPHIVFSDRIKKVTEEVVGNEQNPYFKVKKIYDWIDKNFPWASAREYSTIDNIPEYVLDNRHGDCGQVSLLFITMARCAGIPAKWQSGWMMHPGNKNLHDWAEVYYEGIGWVPVDQSFGRVRTSQNPDVYWYYTKGIDAYRLIVNQDIGRDFYPIKVHPRSETVDFQRGEVEWRGGNLYFNHWNYNMNIVYKSVAATVPDPILEQKAVKNKVEGRYGPTNNINVGRENYPGYGTSTYQSSTAYPSSYQYTGSSSIEENAIKNGTPRPYLRSEENSQSSCYQNSNIPASPVRESVKNEMYQFDSYQSNSSYQFNPNSSYSRMPDNSVSQGYTNQFGSGSGSVYRYPEDRYTAPSERLPFPYSPPYLRDMGDPRTVLPTQNNTQNIR